MAVDEFEGLFDEVGFGFLELCAGVLLDGEVVDGGVEVGDGSGHDGRAGVVRDHAYVTRLGDGGDLFQVGDAACDADVGSDVCRRVRLFSEPGVFLVRPDQTLYYASVQTMPFVRPVFKEMVQALDFVIANDYPARGEYTGSV